MKKSIYAIAFATMIATSCGTVKIAVSDDLKASNDEYTVKGNNGTRIKQKISFGEYYTTEIKRSWTKGSSSLSGLGFGTPGQDDWVNIISTEYIRKKQTIRYHLTDGKQQSDVYCVARFNAKDFEIGKSNSILNIGMDILGVGGKSSSNYYVQIWASPTDERPWEMVIDNQLSQARPKEYIGYIAKSKTEYYSIVPVTKLEKNNGKSGNILAGSVGFEFRDPQGKAVAAVSQIDNGMVFLAKIDASQRFLLANACAALLLQDEIE